jgi:hypothetical protein
LVRHQIAKQIYQDMLEVKKEFRAVDHRLTRVGREESQFD